MAIKVHYSTLCSTASAVIHIMYYNSLFCFSFLLSWQWLTPVIILILGWILTMLATLCPTVAYASPNMETGKCIICTWGKKVCKSLCSCMWEHFFLKRSHSADGSVPFPLGINTLINIMSRLGQDDPSPSRFVGFYLFIFYYYYLFFCERNLFFITLSI